MEENWGYLEENWGYLSLLIAYLINAYLGVIQGDEGTLGAMRAY